MGLRHRAPSRHVPTCDDPAARAMKSLKLLVFDTAYSLEDIGERGQEAQILCRDLGGFFDHVWTVHPFATLVTSDSWGPRFGKPSSHDLAPRHTFVEGKVGRFRWLRALFPLNFLIGQLGLFLQLRRLILRERISVIRAPSPLYTGLFALFLARFSGVPLVIRVGANHDELRKFTGQAIEPRLWRSARFEKVIEHFVLSRADLVAGANQNNLDFALANGARPERSTLFRYGNLIDPRHFVEPAKRQRDTALLDEIGLGTDPFIITVARLESAAAVKHPDDVVRLLASLLEDGIAVKAVWVGKGPLQSQVEQLAERLAVSKNLVMAGSRNQDWLAKVLPMAAVYVSTQAGRALSEAALAAVPTVAYDIDWQRELIETGKTGILVPYRDVPGLAAATRQLLDDRARAAGLGKALREKALDMLDPSRLDEHERQEYRKLLARVSTRRRRGRKVIADAAGASVPDSD